MQFACDIKCIFSVISEYYIINERVDKINDLNYLGLFFSISMIDKSLNVFAFQEGAVNISGRMRIWILFFCLSSGSRSKAFFFIKESNSVNLRAGLKLCS